MCDMHSILLHFLVILRATLYRYQWLWFHNNKWWNTVYWYTQFIWQVTNASTYINREWLHTI